MAGSCSTIAGHHLKRTCCFLHSHQWGRLPLSSKLGLQVFQHHLSFFSLLTEETLLIFQSTGEDISEGDENPIPDPPSPEPDAPSAEHLLFKAESKVRLPPPPRHPDPTLDFFSMQFDAPKALQHDLQRPNEMVAPLNSLPQCRFILPMEMKESLAHLQQLSTKTKV